MERRRGDSRANVFLYRHTARIGYRVKCPNVPPAGSCCALCKDTGQIGFFRAERMREGRK